jgi:hypothetical protein
MKHERPIESPEPLDFGNTTATHPGIEFPDFNKFKIKKRKSVFRILFQMISISIYIIGLITCIKFIIGLC